MESINTNLKNTQKTEKSIYDFEKQKDEALKQFQKLYSNYKNNTDEACNKKENTPNKQTENHRKIKAKLKKNAFAGLTDIFFKDQDKTLIIVLIIMLMDNEENMMIIMALVYLLV